MSFSGGTSAAIRLGHDEPRLPSNPSIWCYYLHNQKRLTGAAIHAGNNLAWCAENLMRSEGNSPDYARYDKEAAGINHKNAPYFLPFVFGERCPGWEENRRGAFYGITSCHTEIDLYYAVLEGILFNIYHCYLILCEKQASKRDQGFGGIMNSFWCSWLRILWQ